MNYVYLNRQLTEEQSLKVHDVGIVQRTIGSTSEVLFLKVNKQVLLPRSAITSFDISKTGDLYEFKVCDRCFRHLNTQDCFSDNRHKKDGLITKRPSCKDCRRIKDGKPIPKITRDIWESERPNDYTIFSCPICNKPSIVGITKIVLDHCHKTGKVRGYTCESCNTGIGRFDDELSIVLQAAEWLRKRT